MFSYLKEELKNKKNILLFVLLLVVTVSGVISIFTYGLGINSYDASDFFDGEIWAIETIKSKSIISSNFNYPYIIPFGANLIIAPFVLLLGIGYLSNQLGMLIFYVIYLLAIVSLANSLYKEFDKKCIFVTIASLFVFTYAGENILHHILYYGLAYVCSIGSLACVINIFNEKNINRNYIGLFIWCLWSASNGIATIALTNCTLLGAVGIYALVKEKNILKAFKKKYLFVYITIILSIVFGYVAYALITANAIDLGGVASRFDFVDATTMIKNATTYLINDYLRCFYAPISDISLSIKGIIAIGGLLFSVAVLFFSIFFSIVNIKKYDDGRIITLLNLAFIAIVCLGEYILTSSSERYLINVILYLFIICGINVTLEFKNKLFKNFIAFCLLSLICAFSVKNIYLLYRGNKIYRNQMQVIDTLKERNLEYGLAKYSYIYTVLSSDEIKCLPMNEVSMGKVSNNTNVDFYKNGCPEGTKEFFMLLPRSRYQVLLNGHKDFLENAKETIVCCDEYYIVVFDIEYWDQIEEHGYAIAQRS